MAQDAASAASRGRIPREFVVAARSLAIARAACDAHRTECDLDPTCCTVCTALNARVADARLALQRDRFS